MRITTYNVDLNLSKLSRSTNKAPIRLRITKDRKHTYRTLLHVEPEYWDSKNKIISKKHPSSMELNALLKTRIAQIQKRFLF